MENLVPPALNNAWFASDKNTFQAITVFLNAIDKYAPHVSDALISLQKLYTPAVANLIERKLSACIERLDKSVPFDTPAPWVPPLWVILSDAEDPDCFTLLAAVHKWSEDNWLVDVNPKRRRFIEIGLQVLRKVFNGWSPTPGTAILCEGFLYDEEAAALSVRFNPTVSTPSTDGANAFASYYPFVFAPPVYPIYPPHHQDAKDDHTDTRTDYRQPAEWEQLLYEHRAMQMGSKPAGRRWSGMSWNPRIESWSDFHRRIMNEFEAYLQAYRDRTLDDLQLHFGWEIYEDSQKRRMEHYVWLAQFQCAGWDLQKVATHASYERSGITHRIKEAVNNVGLKLRPSTPGRRPKIQRNQNCRIAFRNRGRPRKTAPQKNTKP